MKIAILTYVAGKSSKILAEALKSNGIDAEVLKASLLNTRNFRQYDAVFAYGCSYATEHKKRINSQQATYNCISKPTTFDILRKAEVNTVEYCLRKQDIPAKWDWVVIREQVNGRKAEGLSYHENNKDVPNGELFSEYFEHKYEYRIVVFMGKVVGRYFKKAVDGDWYFNNQPKQGFEMMDDHCIRAAKALGIDYVGFDVVANTKKDFRILEANSGPAITDEAENAIVSYFINL